MIIFVTTEQHRYTTRGLCLPGAPVICRWSWERLFRSRFFPRATYVLTDFDRLKTADIELAGRFHGALVRRGMRVLNDPRLFLPRDIFLRRMHRAGINSFTCWRPAEGEQPDRFPVFLRTIAAHRGVLSGLLGSQAEVDEAVAAALKAGHPLLDLLVIEYAAAPNPDGVFEKRAAYLVGDRIVPAPIVNDTNWVAKEGQLGLASDEGYRNELQEAKDMPHAAHLRRVFATAGASFGRLDYTILNGRPEIFELNTNPRIKFPLKHPNADRLRSLELGKKLMFEALHAIDTPACADPSTWCATCGKHGAGEFGVAITWRDRQPARKPSA